MYFFEKTDEIEKLFVQRFKNVSYFTDIPEGKNIIISNSHDLNYGKLFEKNNVLLISSDIFSYDENHPVPDRDCSGDLFPFTENDEAINSKEAQLDKLSKIYSTVLNCRIGYPIYGEFPRKIFSIPTSVTFLPEFISLAIADFTSGARGTKHYVNPGVIV